MSKVQNPQLLLEAIARSRIYECDFWREQCFALNAAYIVDKAVKLKSIGGLYGGSLQPTDFICLVLKLLQLQPEPDIILAYIEQEDFKYLRALGAFYYRLTAKSAEVYSVLEPLLNDKRKLRLRNKNAYELTYMDEFVDQLLREERVCDTILPRLTMRFVLEELGELEPRVSLLEDELEEEEDGEDVQEVEDSLVEDKEEGEMQVDGFDDENQEYSSRLEERTSRSTSRKNGVSSDRSNPYDGRKEGRRGRDTRRRRSESRTYSRSKSSRSRSYDRYGDDYYSSPADISGRHRRSISESRSDEEREARKRENKRDEYSRERDDSRRRESRSRSYDKYNDSRRNQHDERKERRSGHISRSDSRSRNRYENEDYGKTKRKEDERDGMYYKERTSSTSSTKKEHKFSSKKVYALFKKKSTDKKKKHDDGCSDSVAALTAPSSEFKEEMSIEETNRIRISLGLKPLKR